MVHFKDWSAAERRVTPLGSGDVDFVRALDALTSIAYTGWLNVELPPAAHDPEETARDAVHFLKGLTEKPS
jgi:sugar phosphate isomerase/epimerase